jgi:hypothetical protein
MQSEVVVRVGADTSGFKKGVDDVAAQTARMRNDMRVAFDAGVAGSRNVRTAFKGMLDVAGQSGGPLAQMLGGIKDIFDSFRVNPMLGAVSAIGAAVTAVGKLAEKAADNALKKTAEAVASMRRSQAMLRALNPELLDPVQQARTRAARMIEGGEIGAVRALIEEEQGKADEITARERTRTQRLPQIDIEAEALRSRIETLRMAVGPSGVMPESSAREMSQAMADLKKLQEERAGLALTPSQEKQRQAEQKQIAERIEIYRDAEKEILEIRKKEAEDLAKEQERANKKSQEQIEKANADRIEAERELSITVAEMRDPSGELARREKEKFIEQDLKDAEALAESKDPAIAAKAKADIARLNNERVGIAQKRLSITRDTADERREKAKDIAEDRKTAQRNLALETARGSTERMKLREKYLREDITAASAGTRNVDPLKAAESMNKLIELQREAVSLQKEIKKNTAGGARG